MKYFSSLWLVLILCSCAGMPAPKAKNSQDTYYVAAGGSDRNNGLSEAAPFRSLFKAMVMAASGPVNTITVIGILDVTSEQSTNKERVFLIQAERGTGKRAKVTTGEILIRGRDGAVLSAEGSGRRVALVRGTVPIRFENIEISGGSSSGEGGGLGIGPGSRVILGSGAVIKNNRSENVGGGVLVAPGALLLIDGGKILDNTSSAVGGGVAAAGAGSVLVMLNGEVGGNHAQGGGGAAVYQGGSFVLSGGDIGGNQADLAGGGVVLNQGASLTMDGGFIRGNRSSVSGGGIAILEHSSFTLTGGEIQHNEAAEHGGGIAADQNGTITIEGGFIGSNRAGGSGGGIFTTGSFVKTAGTVYGSDVPDEANVAGYAAVSVSGGAEKGTAAPGAAIYIFRGGPDKVREESAGSDLVLDSGTDEGWIILYGEGNEVP